MSSNSVDGSHTSNTSPQVVPSHEEQDDHAISRVKSALTVENVKTFEEETGSVDVVELLSKNAASSNADNITDVVSEDVESSQPNFDEPLAYATPDKPMSPISDDSKPGRRHVTRGHKFTGEEYVAVSIDVQTDESWIAELGYWKKDEKKIDETPMQQAKYFTESGEEAIMSTEKANDSNDKSFKDMEAEFIEDDFTNEALQKEKKTALDFQESDSVFDPEDSDYIVTNVGPPSILQYKAESKVKQIDYKTVKTTFPKNVDLNALPQDEQEYYSEMLDEMKELRDQKRESENGKLINIHPHSAFGSTADSKIAKEHAAERSRQREVEKQKQTTSGYAATNNQTNFYAFARQLKTVNYALSSEKCMEEGWTIRPVTPVSSLENEQDSLLDELTASILSGKKPDQRFVYKQYNNGSPFLAIFPDGTGNVWYTSGNPAVSVITSEKTGKLSFIAHDDKSEETNSRNILAVFSANGKCVCYYPNGALLMLLSPLGGEYFNERGVRIKQWNWRGLKEHVHAPPFQPITFTLSRHLSVRVLSQESIYVTFMDKNKSVRFNCGTKLMIHQRNKLPKIDDSDVEQAELEEKVLYVRMILERVNNLLQYPNASRSNKIKLPSYLAAKDKQSLHKKIETIGHLPQIRRPLRRKNIVVRKALKLPKFYKTTTIAEDMSENNNDLKPLVTVN